MMRFNELSPDSRIWIFQSNRKLTSDEIDKISREANHFAKNWVSHNNRLKAAAEILYDQFLILAVEEDVHEASGCSIDSSFSFINDMENKYNLSFMERDQVAFLIQDAIRLIPYKDIKHKLRDGKINKHTSTFNNLVSKKSDLDSKWLIPVSESWVSKYL